MKIKYLFIALCMALLMATGAANASGHINVNTATVAQLQTLSGIGPKTAAAIIDYRSAHGLFSSVDALMKVKGIGKKRLETIRDDLEVSHINE